MYIWIESAPVLAGLELVRGLLRWPGDGGEGLYLRVNDSLERFRSGVCSKKKRGSPEGSLS